MSKLGLKLWSTNLNYIKEAQRLFDKGVYHYIELFAVPETCNDVIKKWVALKIPFVIHGSHYSTGLNFADKSCFDKNMKLVDQAKRFADGLNSEIIIFHPGVAGDINQTVYQLNQIKDKRIVIENKPYFAIMDNLICNGNSPQEIEKILKETGVGFCLDFAHAIFTANALRVDKLNFIKKFMLLNPKIFHVTDGDWYGIYDEHLNLGQGSFEFDKLIKFLSYGSMITLETKHNFENSLQDFEQDIRSLMGVVGY